MYSQGYKGRLGCRTTRDGFRGGVRGCGNVTIVPLKTVSFGGSFSIEVWIDIHGCGRMGLMTLNVTSDDLVRGGNHRQKEFSRVRHGSLIVGSGILEFLPEFL